MDNSDPICEDDDGEITPSCMDTLAITDWDTEYESSHPLVDMAGKADYEITLYYDEESERGLSRSYINMQSGRMHCNYHDEDEYCHPS